MTPTLEPRLAVVIEDDPDIRNLLRTVLERSGFQTVLTSSGPEGIDAVRTFNPIVTTLDINMPGMDGFAVARRLREFSSTYLIMLTALDDEIDIIQGLEAGADDYLVKPFRPRELRARIETVLRRPRQLATGAAPAPAAHAAPAVAPLASQPFASQPVDAEPVGVTVAPVDHPVAAGPAVESAAQTGVREAAAPAVGDHSTALEPDASGWLHRNGLSVNVASRTVSSDGRNVNLTRSEFDLLASLMHSGRRVRSKADLALTLHGQEYVTSYFVNEADKRAIEVHMTNLRRKIGDSTANPRWIETVRGVGYRMLGN